MLRVPMSNRTPALLLLSLFTSAIAWSATPDETKCKAGKAQSCALAGRARIDSEEYALAKPLLEKGCKHGSSDPAERCAVTRS